MGSDGGTLCALAAAPARPSAISLLTGGCRPARRLGAPAWESAAGPSAGATRWLQARRPLGRGAHAARSSAAAAPRLAGAEGEAALERGVAGSCAPWPAPRTRLRERPPATPPPPSAKAHAPSPAAASTRTGSALTSPSGRSATSAGDEDAVTPNFDAQRPSRLFRQIWPHRDRAHRRGDVWLLERFLELAELRDVGEDAVRLLLGAIKLLWCCDYAQEDVCSILAHASVYFRGVSARCGGRLNCEQVGRVLVVLVYLAHTWVQDETCDLKHWQSHLFSDVCSVVTLRNTSFRLLQMRGFVLRVQEEELLRRHDALQQACE